jgi:hypothetical protein
VGGWRIDPITSGYRRVLSAPRALLRPAARITPPWQSRPAVSETVAYSSSNGTHCQNVRRAPINIQRHEQAPIAGVFSDSAHGITRSFAQVSGCGECWGAMFVGLLILRTGFARVLVVWQALRSVSNASNCTQIVLATTEIDDARQTQRGNQHRSRFRSENSRAIRRNLLAARS